MALLIGILSGVVVVAVVAGLEMRANRKRQQARLRFTIKEQDAKAKKEWEEYQNRINGKI